MSLAMQVRSHGDMNLLGSFIMAQNSTEFDPNPVLNQLQVVNLGLYVYAQVGGSYIWYPLVNPPADIATYIHSQVIANTVWTVNHGLNTPLDQIWFQIRDNNNAQIDEASLTEIDANSFQINFNAPQSGKAIIVGTTQVIIGKECIGDGTGQIKISGYGETLLNFVAGSGISLNFDNVSKSITINNQNILQDATNTTNIGNIITSAGLNSNGTFLAPTGTNYLDASNSLNNIALLLDAAIKNEVNRATNSENSLSSEIAAESTARTIAYGVLASDISAEANARSLGDSANTTAIASLATTLAAVEATANAAVPAQSNSLPLTNGNVGSTSITTTTTAGNQTLDSFLIADVRTVKYVIQISSNDGQYQAAEILVIHNGVTPTINEIADIYTGSDYLATFDAVINGNSFYLLTTPSIVGLTYKLIAQYINS